MKKHQVTDQEGSGEDLSFYENGFKAISPKISVSNPTKKRFESAKKHVLNILMAEENIKLTGIENFMRTRSQILMIVFIDSGKKHRSIQDLFILYKGNPPSNIPFGYGELGAMFEKIKQRIART